MAERLPLDAAATLNALLTCSDAVSSAPRPLLEICSASGEPITTCPEPRFAER